MLENEFLRIGLTQREIKVYLTLLKLGESTTGKIIENSGVSSGKIYEILGKLIDKGLATYIVKEKTKYFQAANPKKILEFIESKKIEIENDKKRIEKLLPKLTTLYGSEKPDYRVIIYKGFEGFKTALYETLEGLAKDDEWLGFEVSSSSPERNNPVWNKFNNDLAREKIPIKLISSDKQAAKKLKKRRQMEIRIIGGGASASVSIAGNVLLIFNWKKLSIIKITNKDIANSFRKFFYGLWSISKKLK